MPGQLPRRLHRHLLPEDGTHGQLEPVPAAGRAQAGSRGDQRRQQRILRQMGADLSYIRAEIEHPPHPRNDSWQRPQIGNTNIDAQALPLRQMADLDGAEFAVLGEGPAVAFAVDPLDARDRPRPQERQHRGPVIGRPVAQPHSHAISRHRSLAQRRNSLAAQRTRRPLEQPLKGLVESPHAAEAGGQRDLAHGQARIVDQLLGQQHAPRLRHRDRRGAEMLIEQAPQLPLADAKPRGQTVDAGVVAIQRTLGDQRQAAGHRVRRAAPGAEIRRRFRPAAQAGTKAGLLRRRGRRKEPAVLELGRARRTNRPAIDAGRSHADEDPPIETGVAGAQRAVTNLRIECFHCLIMPPPRARRSRFSDMVP